MIMYIGKEGLQITLAGNPNLFHVYGVCELGWLTKEYKIV